MPKARSPVSDRIRSESAEAPVSDAEVDVDPECAGGDELFVLMEAAAPRALPAPLAAERTLEQDSPRAATPKRPGAPAGRMGFAYAIALVAAALLWVIAHPDYYLSTWSQRRTSVDHAWLRPMGGIGFVCGAVALVCVTCNLLYLLRRSRFGKRLAGGLRSWLSFHMAMGLTALVFAVVHAGYTWNHTSGGHALLAMGLLVCTGAFGRFAVPLLSNAMHGRLQTCWRFVHRWTAFTMVLLLALHVVTALRYARWS